MRIRRRTAVEVTTRQVTTVHERSQAIPGWCGQCKAQVPMVTPEHAAELAHARPRAIYRRVENGEVHFMENAAGELLICSASLAPGN